MYRDPLCPSIDRHGAYGKWVSAVLSWRVVDGREYHRSRFRVAVVGGLVRWVHVHASTWLTFSRWHPKRGAQGIEAVGVIARFTGRAMYDRGSSYDRSPCTHSLCEAHLIGDAIFVAEQEKQPWAPAMVDHLRHMVQVTTHWRAQASQVSSCPRARWVAGSVVFDPGLWLWRPWRTGSLCQEGGTQKTGPLQESARCLVAASRASAWLCG